MARYYNNYGNRPSWADEANERAGREASRVRENHWKDIMRIQEKALKAIAEYSNLETGRIAAETLEEVRNMKMPDY